MICNQCGGNVPDGCRFCIYCGTPLESSETPPAPQVPAVPRKKGKIWTAILALALIFSLGLGVFLFTQYYTAVAKDPTMPWFTVVRGTLHFDPSLYTGSAELTVPATISGQPITALSNSCFADCDSLVTVHLPEGLRSIGDGAFAGCDNLRGIKLPETVTYIGSLAFANCGKLEAICIPYSLQQVGAGLFEQCSSLKYIFYPGPIAYWDALDISGLGSSVTVYAADGAYPQD